MLQQVVCLSVRMSLTLKYHGHRSWNSSKIISHLVTLGCSLSVDLDITGLLQREHPKFWPKVAHPPPVELSVADIRWQIPAEWSETAQWSQWRAYTKLPSLFRMEWSMTPYDLPPSSKWGSQMYPSWYVEFRTTISPQRVIHSNPLHVWFYRVGFSGSADRMALFPVRSNPRCVCMCV